MKTTELAIIAAAALVLMMVVRKATATTPKVTGNYNTTRLNVGNANGWQYFSDGTAIGPDGKYYYHDALVYDPAGMMSL